MNYIQEWEKVFLQNRPYLISLSFRLTGSLAETEDIVQETFLACVSVNPETIDNHKAWLTRVCSNKGLDYLKLAYKRRESLHDKEC